MRSLSASPPSLAAIARRLTLAPPIPLRIQLEKKEPAALLLVDFSDRASPKSQLIQRAQESSVALLPPADVARPPPPGSAKSIEAAVITDAAIGIRLDVVICRFGQGGPGLEQPGVGCGHPGQGGPAPVLRLGQG